MCAYGRPHLSFCPIALHTLVSSLDEYADGCLFEKGSDKYPFCLGGGNGWRSGGWVVPQGGPHQNLHGTCTPFLYLPSWATFSDHSIYGRTYSSIRYISYVRFIHEYFANTAFHLHNVHLIQMLSAGAWVHASGTQIPASTHAPPQHPHPHMYRVGQNHICTAGLFSSGSSQKFKFANFHAF